MWLQFIEKLKLVWIFLGKVHVHTTCTKAFHVKVQSYTCTYKGTRPSTYKDTSLIYVGYNQITGVSSKNMSLM